MKKIKLQKTLVNKVASSKSRGKGKLGNSEKKIRNAINSATRLTMKVTLQLFTAVCFMNFRLAFYEVFKCFPPFLVQL